MKEKIIVSKMNPVEESTKNLYKVSRNQWRKWNEDGRKMFNYLYGQSVQNRAILCGTDLFGESKQVRQILNATTWNMAWEAADYATYLKKK